MKKNLFTIIIALVCSIFACEAQNLMLDTEVPDTSIALRLKKVIQPLTTCIPKIS